jgi:hypothetical protein
MRPSDRRNGTGAARTHDDLVSGITKEDAMSVYSAGSPTFVPTPTARDQHLTDPSHTSARPSRAWALVDALADLGACIDPSGMLAGQRLRRNRQQQQPRDSR